jgi:CheY-like chemotaxis protein
MEGRLKVNSVPGQGSTFFFTARCGAVETLPAEQVPAPAQSAAPAASSALLAARRNRRSTAAPFEILVVDDMADNRVLLQAFLKMTPYVISCAVDGADAVEQFVHTPFDLVLMDLQMPVMDGYEAVARIRAWEKEHGHARVPIVALTAHTRPQDMERSLQAGVDVYLSKPVKKGHLLEQIQRLLNPSSGGRAVVTTVRGEEET